MRYIYIMIIAFFVCACTPINDEKVQENVRQFHEMYQQKNMQKYIYKRQMHSKTQQPRVNSLIC